MTLERTAAALFRFQLLAASIDAPGLVRCHSQRLSLSFLLNIMKRVSQRSNIVALGLAIFTGCVSDREMSRGMGELLTPFYSIPMLA